MGIGGRSTKAELLRYSLAYALGNVKFLGRGLKTFKITEADRYQIADSAIAQLRQHSPWREELDEVREPPVGHGGAGRWLPRDDGHG